MLSGILLAATAVGAQAWEVEDVANRLKAELAGHGMTLEWAEATKDGSSIELSDVSIGDSEGKADLGDLTLQDVSETDGDYRIGRIDVPDYEMSSDEGKVAVQDATISGLMVPKSDESDSVPRYDSAAVGSIVATDKDGKQVFTLANMHAEIQPPPDDGTLAFTGAVESFSVDLAAASDDEGQRAKLEKLGYAQIEGSGELAGSWRPSDGHLKLSRYRVTVEDAGTITASFDMSGYTKELLKALAEMQKQAMTAKEDSMMSTGMAMLGLSQQLIFNGLSLRFEDDGLTQKALNAEAEEQGTTPEALADAIEATIDAQLRPYAGDALSDDVKQAIGTFLDDPQNIEVSARPASPLPFAMLIGAAMTAPQTLVQAMGLEVKANQ